MSIKTHNNRIDLLGITASIACAIHCSVFPIAIALGFLGSGFMKGHVLIDSLFIVLSLFIATFSLLRSYQLRHRDILPLMLFFIGISLIGLGLQFHGSLEMIFATIGGLTVASAHMLNIRLDSKITKSSI